MELGNQIKSLRLSKGLTQEALAEQLGVTAQAVSKWERNAALPDIGLLPQLSVLFGVTIDQIFAIPDEDRLDRIQNMLWDERVLDPVLVEREKAFLLEKARREPENGRPHELLADMENHLADQHRVLAADYAKEALRREPQRKDAHSELFHAFGGGWTTEDWYAGTHNAGIDWYKGFVAQNPDYRGGYLWLMDLLLTDCRVDEAQAVCDALERIDQSYRLPLYRGHIAWARGTGKRPKPSGIKCAGTSPTSGRSGSPWGMFAPGPGGLMRPLPTSEGPWSSRRPPGMWTVWSPSPWPKSSRGTSPAPSLLWRRRSSSWPMSGIPPPGRRWTRSAGRWTD